MRRAWLSGMCAVLVFAWTLGALPLPVAAQAKDRAAREAAEYLLRKFGKEVGQDTVETLARRIERLALQHGDEVIPLVRKGGPAVLRALEEAGQQSPKLLKFCAQHGDRAVWVISRPRSTAIFLKYGDDAGRAILKHGEIAEEVIEHCGQPAAKALAELSEQQARRLAIMHRSGELAQIGRTEELLQVVAKKPDPSWADKTMDFIWRHKGALTVTAALVAFLSEPEAFINGVKDITQIAAENTVGKVSEGVARNTNWTAVLLAGLGALAVLLGLGMYWRYRLTRQVQLQTVAMSQHANSCQPS